jgi:tRNA (uracil-5-)-methyltransferase TRM9
MKPEIAQKIISLNHQFYQSFAADFSETRGRLQPGVLKVLEELPPVESILDLGCGNGKIALNLAETDYSGIYLGADFSLGLLHWATRDIPPQLKADFVELDITTPKWDGILPAFPFETIFCFATLHHIPGYTLRESICNNIRRWLAEGGKLYISVWQFLRSDRLKAKILPWDTVDLSDADVDEGDYLLDWRRGGIGTRYAHFYTVEELNQLAAASGFRISGSFDSDGEGGNLGLYQIWEPL